MLSAHTAMPRVFGPEVTELTLLLLSDLHGAVDKIALLNSELEEYVDAALLLGDVTTRDNAQAFSATEEAEDAATLRRALSLLGDFVTEVVLVPGNHDDPALFQPRRAREGVLAHATESLHVLHDSLLRLAPGLVIAGLGGSEDSFKDGERVWHGFPYSGAQAEKLESSAVSLLCPAPEAYAPPVLPALQRALERRAAARRDHEAAGEADGAMRSSGTTLPPDRYLMPFPGNNVCEHIVWRRVRDKLGLYTENPNQQLVEQLRSAFPPGMPIGDMSFTLEPPPSARELQEAPIVPPRHSVPVLSRAALERAAEHASTPPRRGERVAAGHLLTLEETDACGSAVGVEGDAVLLCTHVGPARHPTTMHARHRIDGGSPALRRAFATSEQVLGWAHGHVHWPESHSADLDGVPVFNAGAFQYGHYAIMRLRNEGAWRIEAFEQRRLRVDSFGDAE